MPWDNSVNKNAVINAVVSIRLVKNMPSITMQKKIYSSRS